MDPRNQPRTRLPVAVLGATGSVGQRLVALLDRHPWFELAYLTASERSAGRPYGDAVQWLLPSPLPDRAAGKKLLETRPGLDCPLVFSALDAEVAGPIEEAFARAGHVVFSNARSHRLDEDVPLLVPEVNPDHLELIRAQRSSGAIVTNPNCSTIGLCLALKPLVDAFGVSKVHIVTLQAISGAGLPGPSGFQMLDNLIPYIAGEEQKIESETRKILGRFAGGRVRDLELAISAQCNRVPVLDGHTLCVSVELQREARAEDVIAAWRSFRSLPQELAIPSAPAQPTRYLEQVDAPQPRLHRDLDGGMSAVIGRLQPCPLLGYKFVVLCHNTLRGAAGGAILSAELAVAGGWIERGLPAVVRSTASKV